MNGASATGGPSLGLEELRASVAAGNPELYRHVALYLQVLRSVLAERVEQACFHLATQVHFQRYLELPPHRRRDLHRRLQQRITHCSSLLTVEQLVALARRLDREKRQEQRQRSHQLLQRLLGQGDDDGPEEDNQQPGWSSGAAETAGPLPPGSVQLDLASPLDMGSFDWIRGSDAAAAPASAAREADVQPGTEGADTDDDQAQTQFPLSRQSGDADDDPGRAGESDAEDLSGRAQQSDAAELMAALIEGLIETGALEQDDDAEQPDGPAQQPSAAPFADAAQRGAGFARQLQRPNAPAADRGGNTEAEEGVLLEAELSPGRETGAEAPSPWEQPGLPHDPVLLLRWLEGLEAALERRLRNLSHAINVDLLRHGLSRGLLPVSLLEAVLQGQIETLASPANVLRLQLPFGLRPGARPLQAIAILLRPVDLEMEEPRLRTCRRRIHQHRLQVRKMAQTYRRLQRRLQAHEAERLWLQDIRASRTAEI